MGGKSIGLVRLRVRSRAISRVIFLCAAPLTYSREEREVEASLVGILRFLQEGF